MSDIFGPINFHEETNDSKIIDCLPGVSPFLLLNNTIISDISLNRFFIIIILLFFHFVYVPTIKKIKLFSFYQAIAIRIYLLDEFIDILRGELDLPKRSFNEIDQLIFIQRTIFIFIIFFEHSINCFYKVIFCYLAWSHGL